MTVGRRLLLLGFACLVIVALTHVADCRTVPAITLILLAPCLDARS